MRYTAALSLILALPISAQWTEEPESFVGVEFGAPVSAAAEVAWQCYDAGDDRTLCEDNYFIGDVFGELVLGFGKSGDLEGFSAGHFDFSPKSFVFIRTTAIAKWGDPHNVTQQEFTTPLGGKIVNEILTWTGDRASVMLMRIADRPDRSRLYVFLNDWEAQQRNEKLSKAIEATDDF